MTNGLGENPLKYNYSSVWPLLLILFLALSMRVFALTNTHIMNLDGIIYINQAKALFYGQWSDLTSCFGRNLSNYPIFIVAAYKIIGDWILAARWVNILFGTLTLVPFFYLCRRFFDARISGLTTLIYAFNPSFVAYSVYGIRGPIFWFFLVLGLFLFILALDHDRNLYLLLSSISFLLAAWGRVEALGFIFVSIFFLLLPGQKNRLKSCAIFLIPVAALLAVSLAGMVFLDKMTADLFRLNEIKARFLKPVTEYTALYNAMKELAKDPPPGIGSDFLARARKVIWLIGLGTLGRMTMKAYFFYPVLLSLIGLSGIYSRMKNDRRILYFLLLTAVSFTVVYLLILHTWYVERRYMAAPLFASFIFLGFGLQKLMNWSDNRIKLKPSIITLAAIIFIIGISMFTNLKVREADKAVFKEIGNFLAQKEGHARAIRVYVPPHLYQAHWPQFYANLEFKGFACFPLVYDVADITAIGAESHALKLKERGFAYYLLVEHRGPQVKNGHAPKNIDEYYLEVGRWTQQQYGRLILYKVR